jgi:hypothetical protein
MDLIDEHLTTDSLNPTLSSPIRAALGLAKKVLNKYYEKTDFSDVYRITMSMCV